MGQIRHGSATTTAATRLAIPYSQESLRMLAKRHGINPKTVAKWKTRTSTADRRTGPSDPHSTVLSVEDEAVIVAFLPHNLLPLDDGLYALQPTIARLTRILAAPLLSAPRHLASARCRGRHACLEVVQALPDFLTRRAMRSVAERGLLPRRYGRRTDGQG